MPDSEHGLAMLIVRKRAGISRVEMARLIGMSPETIRGWEGGARSPSREKLLRFLDVCGVSEVEFALEIEQVQEIDERLRAAGVVGR